MARRAPSPRKVQSNLYVNRTTRDRIDAIALVIPDSRAEVYRRAIEIGLVRLENDYAANMLTQLDPYANRLGIDRAEMAGLMAEAEISLADMHEVTMLPDGSLTLAHFPE